MRAWKSDVRPLLIVGCALVGLLELPGTVPTVRAGFDGPYPEPPQVARQPLANRLPEGTVGPFTLPVHLALVRVQGR